MSSKSKKSVSAWVPYQELVKVAQFLINPDDKRSKADKIIDAGLTEQVGQQKRCKYVAKT